MPRIYTKTGDKGFTSMYGGAKISKSHIRIECYGTIDELNAYLGLLSVEQAVTPYRPFITTIQNTLFIIGANLNYNEDKPISNLPELREDSILDIEKSIDNMNALLPDLDNFILPGGNRANALSHVARTICRRVERLVVRLHESYPINTLIIKYLNRLSDWLFVMARMCTKICQTKELIWNKNIYD